jgi:predicted ABC-type ATPase
MKRQSSIELLRKMRHPRTGQTKKDCFHTGTTTGISTSTTSEDKIIHYANCLLAKTKTVENPVFLIKYGPPASGKGRCLDNFHKFAEMYGFDSQNYIDVNVDAFVDKLDIHNEIKQDPEVYWKYRPIANKIGDAILSQCFSQRKHVVLEMTGGNVDQHWLNATLIEPARKEKYTIIVVYPLVPKNILIERSEARAKEIGRRPDPQRIIETAEKAAENIKFMHTLVDHLIIYDNSSITPCDVMIINCSKDKCDINIHWMMLNLIKEKFQINLNV